MNHSPIPQPAETTPTCSNTTTTTAETTSTRSNTTTTQPNTSTQHSINIKNAAVHQNRSFTNAIKKPDYSDDDNITPKKEQGIIIESAEGINLKQYMEHIGKIIQPENIINASRLSRDKICMYLASKKFVNDITDNYDNICIDGQNLNIRPLIIKSTKFYLTKVDPRIPSSIIHDEISNLNINITSKIKRERKLVPKKTNFLMY